MRPATIASVIGLLHSYQAPLDPLADESSMNCSDLEENVVPEAQHVEENVVTPTQHEFDPNRRIVEDDFENFSEESWVPRTFFEFLENNLLLRSAEEADLDAHDSSLTRPLYEQYGDFQSYEEFFEDIENVNIPWHQGLLWVKFDENLKIKGWERGIKF